MTVLVAGTFDLLHPGHVHLLRVASRHGKVHVVVARDSNSKKVKGHLPVVPERQRLEMVRALKLVCSASLGHEDEFDSVLEFKPDVIVLGPDQHFQGLREKLRKHGLKTKVIRLRKRYNSFPLCASSDIISKARK